jgi:hypothetical protein
MQLGGGTGLAFEAHPLFGVARLRRHDLERDVAAEGHLFRFVDDAHAAAADLADESEIAELRERKLAAGRCSPGAGAAIRDGDLFHHRHGGENFANLGLELRVPIDVLAQRRPLAVAIALQELFDEFEDKIGFGFGTRHLRSCVTQFSYCFASGSGSFQMITCPWPEPLRMSMSPAEPR